MSRQHRSWCLTLNNWTEDERKALLDCEMAKYVIIAKERGENGTPHLQGYIQFKNPKTLGGCKRINERAHWEPARGSPTQNINYCLKGEQSKEEWQEYKEAGPNWKKNADWEERGIRPKNGKRTNQERAEENARLKTASLNELVDNGEISIKEVRALKNARMDLAQEAEPYRADDVRGVWIYGPPGTGKTHKARHDYPGAFIKQQNKWWCGYMGEEYVVLDDFDVPVLGHYIKIWADRWECTGEVKGAKVNLQHKKFIITSNYHPNDLWPDHADALNKSLREAIIRRFEIIHMPFKRGDPANGRAEPIDNGVPEYDIDLGEWEQRQLEREEEEEKRNE